MSNSKTYIRELKEGTTVESVFICTHKSLFTDKNGKPYLALTLYDRSGSIEGRIWEKAPLLTKNFERNDYILVKGNVVSFQGRLQYNIFSITRMNPDQINSDDFIPHTAKNISEMYQKLLRLCREEIQNRDIQQLILSILEDPEYAPKFQRAPAAKSNHHAWIGGLLEHVLQLCELARDVLPHYPRVNRDLVYAGLIMHDFGKIEEISMDRSFEYTDKGKLIGHLITSVEILIKKAVQIPNFPKKILEHIQHIILSHHGKLEYGSPKEPMTLEAVLVHELDHLDSRMQAFLDIVARDSEGNANWTGNNIVFGQPIYKHTEQDLGRSSVGAPSHFAAKNTDSYPKSQSSQPEQHREPEATRPTSSNPEPKILHSEPTPQHETPAPMPRRQLDSHPRPAQHEPQRQPRQEHSRADRPKPAPRGPLKASLGELLNLQLKKEG